MTHDGAAGRSGSSESAPEGITWRQLYDEARSTLAAIDPDQARSDARRIVEEASGCEAGQLAAMLERPPMKRAVAYFDSMLERRRLGEPLQYVLGRWGFRTLDLAVDRRVLIPRPETEIVAGIALAALPAPAAGERPPLAADLGTGSGCIGLSLVVEHATVQVVCTDSSADAVAAASANAAGVGRPATRVVIRQGDWFDALPPEHRGAFDLIVANPPYIADDDDVPPAVTDWEPSDALFAGPTGLEHADVLIAGGYEWLRPGGALVLELGATQLAEAAAKAERRGYTDIEVHRDLAGQERVLVARAPAAGAP